jgi:2-dehydropantoate 2-reductase
MRALVVGAGAVGQVIAHALRSGGAEVGLLVKPAHAAEAIAGFTLYPLNRRRAERWRPVPLRGLPVYTRAAELAGERWDVVVLAVASPALGQTGWIAELAGATGEATIAVLQPGAGDAARVAAIAGRDRVVSGAIGMMAFRSAPPNPPPQPSPLRGEGAATPSPRRGEGRVGGAAEPPVSGTAYWIPPLAGFPLTGGPARVATLAAALRAGGIPASAHPDAPQVAALGSALLETHVAALRCAGWSRSVLAGDRDLGTIATQAAREALAVIGAGRGRPVPLPARLAAHLPGPLLLGGLARLAPMSVDRFLAAHYRKVTAQTRAQLDAWIADGARHGVATGALEALRDRWQRQVDRAV